MSTMELVSIAGSSETRRNGRTEVASSEVTIWLNTDAAVEKCLRGLEVSDQRLAEKPQKYDWKFVWKETVPDEDGAAIKFAVAWYDREFFAENKEAYTNPRHLRMFDGFGDSTPRVEVRHYELVA